MTAVDWRQVDLKRSAWPAFLLVHSASVKHSTISSSLWISCSEPFNRSTSRQMLSLLDDALSSHCAEDKHQNGHVPTCHCPERWQLHEQMPNISFSRHKLQIEDPSSIVDFTCSGSSERIHSDPSRGLSHCTAYVGTTGASMTSSDAHTCPYVAGADLQWAGRQVLLCKQRQRLRDRKPRRSPSSLSAMRKGCLPLDSATTNCKPGHTK